jgi:hypothetical protein
VLIRKEKIKVEDKDADVQSRNQLLENFGFSAS